MEIIEEGFVYEAENQADRRNRVCCFPSSYRLSTGHLLVPFRIGSAKDSADGNGMIAESTDSGSTWSIISRGFESTVGGLPGEVRCTEIIEREPGTLTAYLTWMDRSRAPAALYDAATDTVIPSKLLMTSSEDGGRRWDTPRPVSTGELRAPVLSGTTVRIPGRGWIIPFEDYEPREAGGPSIHSAHALFSSDGRSIETIATVARHPADALYYWDQRQRRCPKTGRTVAMMWTYDRQREADADIHIAWGDPATLTWEEPRGTGIQGQIAAPIPMSDGRLFAFYVHRHDPCSMRLVLSRDAGKTWDVAGELVVYETETVSSRGRLNYAEYWEDMGRWSFGHPSGIALDERTLLLVFYAGRDASCLSVRWARVRV